MSKFENGVEFESFIISQVEDRPDDDEISTEKSALWMHNLRRIEVLSALLSNEDKYLLYWVIECIPWFVTEIAIVSICFEL